MNINDFTDYSDIPYNLIHAVVEQMGDWDSFTESAPDIYNHGIDGGFSGFIYHTETVRFAKDNRLDIMVHLKEIAESIGENGAYSLLSTFKCANGMTMDDIVDAIHDEEHDEHTLIMNCLAWFAAEEVARSFVEMSED